MKKRRISAATVSGHSSTHRSLCVALTGTMGCGKSEALKVFRRLGAAALCLDETAHRVLSKGGSAYQPVLRSFGPAILDRRGQIDRRTLGRIVFAKPALRRRLERLTHPAILSEMRSWMRSRGRGLAVIDVPLLFEKGLEKEFDLTMVVAAKKTLCFKRLLRRDGLKLRELRRRCAAQMPLPEKMSRADVVVRNEGSLKDLAKKIQEYGRAFQLIHGG